ncbi:translocation/assembly module TamB domain-containing protein [Aurantiacibacter sediminis]|uniref:Translocation/assembly module TamB domain-containing protein n=1 Tax=Aurantiacibacter sediminis TaxID=2793064 RepID=A0ABS0N688_9SPHN|nr:translocation/assembly module TamB domain-containing protein [Aurantiacibacter sediminis]MBH5323324.1 translocation/assembly module TamB domain-containing protein [Aurantiacibacter sediminis]
MASDVADTAPDEATQDASEKRTSALHKVLRAIGLVLLGLLILVLLFVAFLHTPPGRQFIVDQISKVAPASGLSVEVGEIDGSILWSSTLKDVELRDANDTLFLEIPVVELNWRPHRWFTSGLDIRYLVARDATLYAAPELIPGDPDAPILPDFDIRVDRLLIEDLTVAEGLLGEERVIQFAAEADIRDGRLFLDADGEFGGGDEFAALIDAEPDGDQFDIDLNWQAPAGGFLATMVGAEEDLAITLEGDGTWTSWEGDLLALQGGEPLLDFDLVNEAGTYRLSGRARPGDYLEGLPARAVGETVMVNLTGTLEDSVAEGELMLRARGFNAEGEGVIDLANNAFEDFALDVQLLDETLFSPDIALEGTELEATLDGPFRDLSMDHVLRIAEVDAGGTILSNVVQRGTASFDGTRFTVPLDADIGRVNSGITWVDPRLVNGTLDGTLVYAGGELLSDDLAIDFRGLQARLGLNANLESGITQVNGPVNIADLSFDGIGLIDAAAQIDVTLGGGNPWRVNADVRGRAERLTNSTIANLAGEDLRFAGGVTLGGNSPIDFRNFNVNGSKLTLTLDGRVQDGETTLAGTGRQADYGPFTVEATLAEDGPRAELVFADPLPAAGLRDVRVAISPSADGFAIETEGQSLLGEFAGNLDLTIPEDGATVIDIAQLDVASTRIAGQLQLADGGAVGDLSLSRGGVDGTIALSMPNGVQAFDVDLTLRNARFGGENALSIARGEIDASGRLDEGNTTIRGSASAQGLSYGGIFIGRLAANASVVNGNGEFDAAIAGRRGSQFELLINGRTTSDRIAVAVDGSYEEREISMPRRAVLNRLEDGGWELERSQISFGDGFVIASGRFGGDTAPQGRLALTNMPLQVSDVFLGEQGVGGAVSGVIEFAAGANGLPTGEARLMISDLTRASTLIISNPLDIALVGDLSESLAQVRAVISDDGSSDGRLQARIANLPQSGPLNERLYAGDLLGEFRFEGSAASLWRLAAIELLDVTGRIDVAANMRGTLGNPRIAGSLAGDDLRVRSPLTGTNVSDVTARGSFDGSRFNLTRFSGTASNGGTVSGSGFIDLSGITATRGPSMDIRLAAQNAEILDLANMGATVTGPMRIVSNGIGGTIAGRLRANEARWRLGATSEALAELPRVNITEINQPADIERVALDATPWRYLINVTAPGGIMVDGLGLDSEWRSSGLRIRGTTDDPRVGGEVSIVPRQGFYSFAGTRFEITRGNIDFDENVPIDPRIDLTAETEVTGLSVEVSVEGNASQPQITFSSTPALPEEELLARLLFGGSVTSLSATDALQLGAAVASLRGGSGMGPINQLRDAIGLDRLRIVPADAALDRGTSIALGKNFGRRFYVEIITDGAGYSATNAEFRITNWLNLLATVSTVGRQSVAAEIRRDY